MKERKRALKDKERIIVEFIHKVGGYATANEISTETGISYVTVQKYLDKLKKDGILINVSKGKLQQKKYSLDYENISAEGENQKNEKNK
jgi:biotin operon repressor